MSSYQPPTENLPVFNSAVFNSANTESLSLSKAQSLFLGRTGDPTSVATSTNFTNDITVNGVKVGRGAAGADNTVLGAGAISGINSGTAIGSGANTGNSYATSIGAASQALYNYSTSLGYGAVASGANTVNLGTATETVYCKGTTANGSLVASADIFVKGTIRAGMGVNTTYTTPAASRQTAFGVGALSDANMSVLDCTGVGYNALALNRTGYSSTAVGAYALSKQTGGSSNTAVGTNAMLNFINGAGNCVAVGEQAGRDNNGGNNSFLGFYSGKANTGSANVFVGSYSGDATVGSSDNVMVGSNNTSTVKCTTGNQNTFIGSKIICNGTTGVSNSTALGYGASVDVYSNSTCLGVGSVCTADNQIRLGRSSETIVLDKIAILPTTNGANIQFPTSITSNSTGIGGLGIGWNLSGVGRVDFMALGQGAVGGYTFNVSNTLGNAPTRPLTIDLNELISTVPIRLQSTYTAGAGAGQLGQVVSATTTGLSFASGVQQSFASLSVSAGVWAISYSIDLTNTLSSTTITSHAFYVGTSSAVAYTSKISYGGATKIGGSVIYAVSETACFSGSLTYSSTSSITFYPTALFVGSGGTLTGIGYANATRIG